MAHKLLIGDSRRMLKTLPECSVHCAVTSPPYYGLRDYGTSKWKGGDPKCDHLNHPGAATGNQGHVTTTPMMGKRCTRCGAKRVDDQIGLEESVSAYIERLVRVFRQVRRVLRDDGTFWLNIGDSYVSGGQVGRGDADSELFKNRELFKQEETKQRRFTSRRDVKEKETLGVPWRLAFALQDDGWYLRQEIIWAKPCCMPESVKDRAVRAHEQVFLLTKSPNYYFDYVAVQERAKTPGQYMGIGDYQNKARGEKPPENWKERYYKPRGVYRNMRSVVNVAPKSYRGNHFAVYPPDLIIPFIKAGTSAHGVCSKCGAQYVRRIEEVKERKRRKGLEVYGEEYIIHPKTVGWDATCDCKRAEVVPATVLDPFSGSGTTIGVAEALGRDAIACDLNPSSQELLPARVKMIVKRYGQNKGRLGLRFD